MNVEAFSHLVDLIKPCFDLLFFFSQGFGDCLNDEPTQHDFNFPLVPPGVMYTAEHQCRLQYGVNASVCSLLEVCAPLWCEHFLFNPKIITDLCLFRLTKQRCFVQKNLRDRGERVMGEILV